MGLNVIIVVERCRDDGRWERGEELILHDYQEWFAASYSHLISLQGNFIHREWSFYPRDKWLTEIKWSTLRPVPEDMSLESASAFEVWTNDQKPEAMLLLRDLEETDWEAGWEGWEWTHIDAEKKKVWVGFLRDVRLAVLDKLRPLGGPDDVRLIFGLNY